MGRDTSSHHPLHRIYRDHQSWLRGWLHRRVDNRADAADLAQDVFVRALCWRATETISEPRAFLTTLARRTLFSFWRRRELEQAYLDALACAGDAGTPSAEEQALMRHALESIDRQLAGLPLRARRVFLLNRLDGMTQPEIARTVGVSLATVERDLKQAWVHCWKLRESITP